MRKGSLLHNTAERYGATAIALHWLAAALLIGLFALGLWLEESDYYDPLRPLLYDLHVAVGALTFLLLLARLAWSARQVRPRLLGGERQRFYRLAVRTAHGVLYALPLLVALSGYLLATADGHWLRAFDVSLLPAPPFTEKGMETLFGTLHCGLAMTLAGVVALHVAGALKHHFIDRDATLTRMLRPRSARLTGDDSQT